MQPVFIYVYCCHQAKTKKNNNEETNRENSFLKFSKVYNFIDIYYARGRAKYVEKRGMWFLIVIYKK